MGGFAFYNDNNPTVDVPKSEMFIYIMTHFPDIITNTRKETILDHAESSSLDKFILIAQVACFCMSCYSRLSQHLLLTLLKVSTAAHAFCMLATYFVWWSKPLNVAMPMLLREKEAQEVYALLKCSDPEYEIALEMARKGGTRDSGALQGPWLSATVILAANALGHILNTKQPAPEQPAPEQPALKPPPEPHFRGPRRLIPGNFANKPSDKEFFVLIALAISPMLYGPIHFLAWNDSSSNYTEVLLWCASSIVITCLGLATLLFIPILNAFSAPEISVRGGTTILIIIPLMHIVVSAYIIMMSFVQLAILNSTAYHSVDSQTRWEGWSPIVPGQGVGIYQLLKQVDITRSMSRYFTSCCNW